ncbi:unnamed protein product [Phyllotreta striolata]|uniref:CTLH domain-containing protein n=1 Tax=Phyllotreta striolata TaxID=444603 RepID=A0A9N9TJS9_PHYSR|nr:unnamed protein product [Phyllotreta striolata]
MSSTAARLSLREEDVVRLTLEFLDNRDLHIGQLSLERETGVINGNYSDDVLFLRQLILDGQWDDVLEFIQPLEALESFDMRAFSYAVLKSKYIELLCIKSEGNLRGNSFDSAVDEVVTLTKELEKFAPSKEEYSNLCLLLTLPKLKDHSMYKDWNPSGARVACFRQIYPLVEEFLPKKVEKKPYADSGADFDGRTAKNDRLVQLVIKGVLYESCVNYCQQQAVGGAASAGDAPMTFADLLDARASFGDADLGLLSWLQSVPTAAFAVPFEQRPLHVDVEKLDRPTLVTSWTEHMLATPIRPTTFPHSATPFARPKSAADAMSLSLMPDGAAAAAAAMSASAYGWQGDAGVAAPPNGQMSKSSFASFHLTGLKNKNMNASVDRLFEDSESREAANQPLDETVSYMEFMSKLPNYKEKSGPLTNYGNGKLNNTARRQQQQQYDGSAGTDMTNDFRPTSDSSRDGSAATATSASAPGVGCNSELVREYHKSKQRLQETLAQREREREELIRRINNGDDGKLNGTFSTRSQSPSNVNGANLRGSGEGVSKFADSKTAAASATSQRGGDADANRSKFVPVTTLEDAQAIRCAEFHPSGELYAVGSNSKTLRICAHPKLNEISAPYQPTVLFKRTKHHKGSVYCLAWSPVGDLLATGSNDKTVKLMRFDCQKGELDGDDVELTAHDGTVRDLCFLEDRSNGSSLLISGGAGDCKIYVTDCATGTPFQALSGHTGQILALYTWGGAMFVSGSHDRTIRFWDLRTRGCVDVVSPGGRTGWASPASAVCVDPTGRLLVSGHEDGACALYDIRGGKGVQRFVPHTADVRSVRFSPSAYYLLSGGYDNKLVLTDLQGDLTLPLRSVVVAQHQDKVISARWHPEEFSFLSTSADKTATLWALPPL